MHFQTFHFFHFKADPYCNCWKFQYVCNRFTIECSLPYNGCTEVTLSVKKQNNFFLPFFFALLIYCDLTRSIKRNCLYRLLRSVCQQVLAWALWAAGQGRVVEVRCPVHLCQPSLPSPPVRTCSGWYSQPSSHPRPLGTVVPLGPQPWPNQHHWLTRLTCQVRVIPRGLDSPLQVQTLWGQQPAPSVSPELGPAVHEKSLWVKMAMLVC